MPKSIKYFNVPNLFTLLNLFCGFAAIILVLEDKDYLIWASLLIFSGMIFDFMDGFFARLLNQYSDLGKQLDSLADLVTFGVAPSIIVYQLLKISLKVTDFSFELPVWQILVLISPILIVFFSALRLAKFNIDERQFDQFLGIPTPVSAFFFASLPLLKDFNPDELIIISKWMDIDLPMMTWAALIGLQVFAMENIFFYLVPVVLFSALLVIELPMFSLKFRDINLERNRTRYFFVAVSFFLILFLQTLSFPLIIFLYILLAIARNTVYRIKGEQEIVD
ncbi:MAG: CDP-diacylglycerol--serine O-phosphatidyltransferase [Bacteroidota bacterium]|nr:CDP-diacylglycerol--serine O-phosphatidyltransferase [Bacteroidota bacterium]